jgi:hypothetical protein
MFREIAGNIASADDCRALGSISVMPRLVPGIHASATEKGVDGRVKPGHDVGEARV